jgi:hypothetical protein
LSGPVRPDRFVQPTSKENEMTNRETLEKRATELKLKWITKTTDAQLEKMIAAAEAELQAAAEALDPEALQKRVEQAEAQLGNLNGTLKERDEALAQMRAENEALKAARTSELEAATALQEIAEDDIECTVISAVKHDGADYLPGDRLVVKPAQFAQLLAGGAVAELARNLDR